MKKALCSLVMIVSIVLVGGRPVFSAEPLGGVVGALPDFVGSITKTAGSDGYFSGWNFSIRNIGGPPPAGKSLPVVLYLMGDRSGTKFVNKVFTISPISKTEPLPKPLRFQGFVEGIGGAGQMCTLIVNAYYDENNKKIIRNGTGILSESNYKNNESVDVYLNY